MTASLMFFQTTAQSRLCSPNPFDKEEIGGRNQQLRLTRTTPADCDDELKEWL